MERMRSPPDSKQDMQNADRRVWLDTDRPGERLTLGAPLPGVHLTSVQNSDRCWKEYHLTFNLCLVSPSSKGVGAAYSCRGSHSAGAGDLMAFEPGDHHVTTRVIGGRAAFDLVGIEPVEIEHAMRELGLRGRFHFRSPHMQSPEVAEALGYWVRSVAIGGPRLEVECRFTTLLQKLVQQCSETPASVRRPDSVCHAGVRAARDYLRANFCDEPSLDELARIAGLTRFAFAHAFTRHVGLSPHAYLKLRRASEARSLVERGMPIAEVSRTLGYVDVPLLTRTLKAYFGAPPARWRRCLQVNGPALKVRASAAALSGR